MKDDWVYNEIRRALSDFCPKENPDKLSSWNKSIFGLAKFLASRARDDVRTAKEEVKLSTKKEKAEKAEAKSAGKESNADERIKHFLDNPMSNEEEYKYARAILHVMMESGEIDSQVFDKLTAKIGFSGGEDTKLELVDWSSAFPDIAKAIAICAKPCPIDLISGGGTTEKAGDKE